MLLFSGRYTKRQVDILLNGDNILFNKVPSEFVVVKGNNTFDYIPKELQKLPLEQFRQYISEDCYKKQYIFMTKYLKTALEFCHNIEKENYILVCNLDEELIESYIGVGDYKAGDYRIEYRVPSEFIKPENILDILFYEPYDSEMETKFYEQYKDSFFVPYYERDKANELIKSKHLVFNRDKWK